MDQPPRRSCTAPRPAAMANARVSSVRHDLLSSCTRLRVRFRLRRALAITLTVASTTVPAGIPDKSAATVELQRERALAVRTEVVVEDARVKFIAQRYRRPPAQVRRVVHAAQSAARRHDLPAALLLAIVETESSFDARARSSYGARGLMQVVPRHHPEVMSAIGGAHRLEDPESNIEAGARILAAYVERSGSVERGLARYSGGARKYAAKVRARQRQLERVSLQAARQLDEFQASNSVASPGRS